MPLDLTVTPLYRLNGQDQTSLPGLMASMPPRKAARGRDQDRLIVYLVLAGNAVLSTGEGVQLASRGAVAFYETPGTLTAALRAAAGSINKPLHDRNMSSPGNGQYAVAFLALAAVRDAQVTFLLSGPMHAFLLGETGTQHISDTLSGKGLGLSPTPSFYFSQITLQPNDRMIMCSKVPLSWESALRDSSQASLEATRRRLMTMIIEDVNAVLLQASSGAGDLTMLRLAPDDNKVNASRSRGPLTPTSSLPSTDQTTQSQAESHRLEPSAYGIPPESNEGIALSADGKEPSSNIASSSTRETGSAEPPILEPVGRPSQIISKLLRSQAPSERTRRAAKTAAGFFQSWRRGTELFSEGLRNFLPRLLPGSGESTLSVSAPAMMFIAVLIPLIVVTIASVVYFRYGRSVQYEEYIVQAQNAHTQAIKLSNPAGQRDALQRELFYLDKAESYNTTSDTQGMRLSAQQSLDHLQGIVRLQFQSIQSNGVGGQISRLAASENDIFLLDAQRGGLMHIALTSSGFQRDSTFNCQPGSYGGFTVGPLVDIVAMPPINTLNASVIGVDAAGNLLYCAPGQVPQAIPLPPPDTNWGRVKAFSMDSGNLYVLDSQSRAVWVYVGKDGAFVDRPYFFFGGEIPELDDAIDISVSADDLYILHSDGHLSTCSYSRIASVPTRCVDPAPLVNPFAAYKDVNLFSEAHFTQLMFTPAPGSGLLVLDSDSQSVFLIEPHSLALQSQLRPLPGRANPLPQGSVGAMTVSPNHVMYFAIQDRIYFATNSP